MYALYNVRSDGLPATWQRGPWRYSLGNRFDGDCSRLAVRGARNQRVGVVTDVVLSVRLVQADATCEWTGCVGWTVKATHSHGLRATVRQDNRKTSMYGDVYMFARMGKDFVDD